MAFTIIDINKGFLYTDIEKSRNLFFDKSLSKNHLAPPTFNLAKQ